jgi:hypothetical protein
MDVSSVKDRPVPPTQPPKRTEQVHSEAAKPRTTEAKKAPEAKQMPVVNSQGQTTGRHQPLKPDGAIAAAPPTPVPGPGFGC